MSTAVPLMQKPTDIAPLESLLKVAVIAVLLNRVRPNDTHEVVIVQELPDGKVTESHATASKTVELEGAAQKTVHLLKIPKLSSTHFVVRQVEITRLRHIPIPMLQTQHAIHTLLVVSGSRGHDTGIDSQVPYALSVSH